MRAERWPTLVPRDASRIEGLVDRMFHRPCPTPGWRCGVGVNRACRYPGEAPARDRKENARRRGLGHLTKLRMQPASGGYGPIVRKLCETSHRPGNGQLGAKSTGVASL